VVLHERRHSFNSVRNYLLITLKL
jgi:hypothetical protein